ncbi:restriction endonuclease subunit S [Leuconostoc mesenteroides]|uniref:restriction endonuclease subunit S n=1 Tax=Leuconostoc mesenteroides TaxID=1245 RepID=UPI00235FA90A|nr:restriction endonuclease subunit S [Leuconostoc mesenteroides]
MSKKTPQIRFKGFTDDWEERKLRDVGDTFTGLTGKTKEDFGHGSAKFVTYVNVFQNPIATLDQLDAVEIDEKQNQVQKGDVFFTTSSETPEEVGMSSVWTYDTKNVYLNSFTFGYRPRVSFDLNYMASMLRSPSIRKKITFLAQGISRYNISKTKMLEIEIPAPNLSEQKKIGSFFKLLDDTIALHQRKLDLLKEQKKGFLQKMFPKNGSRVPELRFSGFADDWEERKLGDILSERNDQMPETNEYPLMSFVQGKGVTPKGERYNRSFLVKDSEKKYKKTKLGDFIYSSNNLETGSIGFNRTGKAVISPVYSIFESKKARESQFIGIMSARKDFISEMVRFRQGVVYGQWRIHESDFLNINIKIPNDKEQHLIISLFESIDNTIALHQRKLDLLKEQKKGFLQKMFVS